MANKEKVKSILLYLLAAVGGLAIILALFYFLQGGLRFGASVGKNYPNYESMGMGNLAQAPAMDSAMTESRMMTDETANQDYGDSQLEERKVTKNGELELLVSDAEETATKIINKTLELDGFVQNSNIREIEEGVKSGTIVIKVPADKFDEAFNAFKDYGIKVEREITNSQDVTERYIDLEAQLKNLRAEEERYLDVMSRAYTVEDILKVSQYLSRVRGQIERIEGQLKYLDRQVDMSTITTYLTAEAEVEVFGIRWRPLYEIKKSFRHMLEGIQVYTNAAIAFILYLPVLLLWLISIFIIVWVIVKIIKWLTKKFRHKKDSNPTLQ